ncbi:hypothetical protein [Undibacterium sp. WLHG33]|uniref:hypothetical protein n=1 Tax=Undibacterium sp. WLHG33 TaxID=3412482 RepID=UPI003C2BBE26
MKFILNVRKIEESDVRSSTPFVPDEEDYEMCLKAFADDISGISGISKVVQSGSSIFIDTASSIGQGELKALIKPAFDTNTMQNLRFVSLVESL